MEGVVAKRTLKKSYYEKNRANIIDITDLTNGIYTKNTQNKIEEKEKTKSFKTLKSKITYKICIQSITLVAIVVFVFCIDFLNIEIVKNSDAAKKIKLEFSKNYSFSTIKNKGTSLGKKSYLLVRPIVPKKLELKVISIYKNIQEKFKNNFKEVGVYVENNNNKNEKNKNKAEQNNVTSKTGSQENVGAGTDDEAAVISAISSISSENKILEKIKATKIKFIKPVSGIITSRYGAREKIFEGIDSYHTGTDIGADFGTKVVSSIPGIVKKAEYNKYNGNFIEITNGKITTKYCHLSKITTKLNAKVSAGDEIGQVGSTGLSTGPHLHFEIVYDSTKINPESVLEL